MCSSKKPGDHMVRQKTHKKHCFISTIFHLYLYCSNLLSETKLEKQEAWVNNSSLAMHMPHTDKKGQDYYDSLAWLIETCITDSTNSNAKANILFFLQIYICRTLLSKMTYSTVHVYNFICIHEWSCPWHERCTGSWSVTILTVYCWYVQL